MYLRKGGAPEVYVSAYSITTYDNSAGKLDNMPTYGIMTSWLPSTMRTDEHAAGSDDSLTLYQAMYSLGPRIACSQPFHS